MSRPATFPDGSLLCSCLALALALSLSFNWDFLGARSADPDPNVKNGALLLDRLVKDIVADELDGACPPPATPDQHTVPGVL